MTISIDGLLYNIIPFPPLRSSAIRDMFFQDYTWLQADIIVISLQKHYETFMFQGHLSEHCVFRKIMNKFVKNALLVCCFLFSFKPLY